MRDIFLEGVETDMRKSEVVTRMSEMTGMSEKSCTVWANAFEDAVKEQLKKDGEVSIDGFGTFSVRKPAAGHALILGARRVPPRAVFKPDNALKKEMENKSPYFKAGKVLKDTVNKPINKYEHYHSDEWNEWSR